MESDDMIAEGPEPAAEEAAPEAAEPEPAVEEAAPEAEPEPEPEPAAEEAAPEAAEPEPEPGAEAEEAPQPWRSNVPWWPFLTYGGLWIVLAGTTVGLGVHDGYPYLPENPAFPPLLVASIVLLATAPFLVVTSWLLARREAEKDARTGLFASALLRTSAFSFAGVVLWWAALVLIDALRLDWL